MVEKQSLDDKLRGQVSSRKEKRNSQLRDKYAKAKEMGFSSSEAYILSFWTWGKIYKLAKERGYVSEGDEQARTQ